MEDSLAAPQKVNQNNCMSQALQLMSVIPALGIAEAGEFEGTMSYIQVPDEPGQQ